MDFESALDAHSMKWYCYEAFRCELAAMPASQHYRTLAKEYALKAQRTTAPLLAEGYRKLAEGYERLAEGHALLVEAHRSAEDKQTNVQQSDVEKVTAIGSQG